MCCIIFNNMARPEYRPPGIPVTRTELKNATAKTSQGQRELDALFKTVVAIEVRGGTWVLNSEEPSEFPQRDGRYYTEEITYTGESRNLSGVDYVVSSDGNVTIIRFNQLVHSNPLLGSLDFNPLKKTNSWEKNIYQILDVAPYGVEGEVVMEETSAGSIPVLKYLEVRPMIASLKDFRLDKVNTKNPQPLTDLFPRNIINLT